mmetsp:Transcript_7262/g.24391  ORF Transcript_7262/g.24391 Transcript_7262/m.24391 type:complete len:212 (-) Transcript_7262:5803-6438(-)
MAVHAANNTSSSSSVKSSNRRLMRTSVSCSSSNPGAFLAYSPASLAAAARHPARSCAIPCLISLSNKCDDVSGTDTMTAEAALDAATRLSSSASAIASINGGINSGKCGGSALPATSARAPSVRAPEIVSGGLARFGNTVAKIFGCALSTCFKPSSARGLASNCSRSSGTMRAAASPPACWNNMSNALPAASRTLLSPSHNASRTVGIMTS